jgi:GWxTD domain-containing protein
MRTTILPVLLVCLLFPASAVTFQGAPIPDRDWKAWIDEVRPLMMPSEEKAAKKVQPGEREVFREEFWRLRDPAPATVENENRAGFDIRVQNAEARFRTKKNGPWNECGRAWLLLGKPDVTRGTKDAQQISGSDRMAAMREQSEIAVEVWLYRNPPRLPAAPNGYSFEFNSDCEAVAQLNAQRILEAVAKSYLSPEK